jgi:hypothetical protein
MWRESAMLDYPVCRFGISRYERVGSRAKKRRRRKRKRRREIDNSHTALQNLCVQRMDRVVC